jgi:hypothetical protein
MIGGSTADMAEDKACRYRTYHFQLNWLFKEHGIAQIITECPVFGGIVFNNAAKVESTFSKSGKRTGRRKHSGGQINVDRRERAAAGDKSRTCFHKHTEVMKTLTCSYPCQCLNNTTSG